MSVKNELDNFFERFLAAYQKTEDGLPKRPRRKDVDQAVYVGEADNAGWCKWRPLAYGKEETFIKLLETYGIESNRDIIEYFSTYHFLGFNITTLIISKKPGNTGISRDIRTEFTTDLLLSD